MHYVKSKLSEPWIPIDRIDQFVQFEPAVVVLCLGVGAWLVYRLFLKEVSEERHRNLRTLFKNLGVHLVVWVLLLLSYEGLRNVAPEASAIDRISPYIGFIAVLYQAMVFVKTARILVFEYLFLGNMRAGVPLLLVNIFTLLMSIFLGGWIVTEIFSIKIAPLLATSAIFSLVLGLALQDTLGNLFAGVALQFDKPYEIGDWVEVNSNGQKWVGQVSEISWRATFLVGLADEILTIPNRIMGQAEVSNFSLKTRPIIRSQVFRVPYGSSVDRVKAILLESLNGIAPIRKNPAPLAIVSEANESWLSIKLVYFIDNYGAQYLIADQVITQAISSLEREGFYIAPPRLFVATGIAQTSSGPFGK